MKDRRKEIGTELEKGMTETIAFFSALTPQQLETTVYEDDVKWTALQILAHLATIESSMHWLFKDILAGGAGSPPDFDLDRFNYNQVKKLDDQTVDELLERFKTVRLETITIVDQMTEADLDREGRHAFHGHGKLERFIRWAAEHADLHIADIGKAMA
jgi:hypothetical protein